MNYIIYNPLADNSNGDAQLESSVKLLEGTYPSLKPLAITKIDWDEFFKSLKDEDNIILCGGDGTINRFANIYYGKNVKGNFFLRYSGTGNDFARDIDETLQVPVIPLNKYIEKLPKVIINGKETRFVNGIGYGIDGLTCVEAERMKKAGAKKIDYASITIKLLLFKYKAPSGTVTVDGRSKRYKKIWLASAMNGKYYGGGMKVAPTQDRLGDTLSLCIFHGSNRLGILMAFPSIFKGEHINKKKIVDLYKGKEIEVKFDSPMALQIDGEVVEGVTSYKATY